MTRRLALLVVILATIGCDRVTKHLAETTLEEMPDRSYLADTIRLGYTENTGGFLSIGANLPPVARTILFTLGTGVVLCALALLLVRRPDAAWSSVGLALFVAGGASNWIDRVIRGSVVDFLNVGIGPVRTGIFNVADVAIMIGLGCFVIGELIVTPPAPGAPEADSPPVASGPHQCP